MTTPTLYNDNDPGVCAWLNELIAHNHLPHGTVLCKSIADLAAADLADYPTVHAFAGIGGWAYALQLAGWPSSLPVWTASCPCQPLSCAGQRNGERDARHLWPELYRLVSQRHPPVIFGEQVGSRDGLEWLDGISLDLEELGYAVGSSDLPAACVGAPHSRQRVYWVAVANGRQSSHTDLQHTQLHGEVVADGCQLGGLVYSTHPEGARLGAQQQQLYAPSTAWSLYDLLPCRDNKTRRIESGTFPLAHGVPARLGRLRGYGNAIVPQVAATFIQAMMDVLGIAPEH